MVKVGQTWGHGCYGDTNNPFKPPVYSEKRKVIAIKGLYVQYETDASSKRKDSCRIDDFVEFAHLLKE